MKNKLIATFMLFAMTFSAFSGGAAKPLEVFAASKAATLVDTKVSFDGNAPITVQSYRIDGYNYVRAAEIAKHINMGVIPATYETGVVIQINTPYTGGELEKLTETSISAELTTGTVFYDGMRYENAECFKYNNRYYYKLADLIAASQYALEQNIVFTERYASGNHWKEAAKKTFTTFDITWDAATGTVNVNRKVTALQKIFDDIRGGKKAVSTQSTQNTLFIAAKPELTSAPEVGAVLADILIDKSKGAYNADGSVNTDNVTQYYRDKNTGYFGQCTWYAFGRFEETTGIDLSSPPNQISGKTLGIWADRAMNGEYPNVAGTTDKSAITARSIAVWANHVVFIEYVERDNSGSPTNVYYTEANFNHDGKTRAEGVYCPDFDCKVKVKSYGEFVKNGLMGYVMAK